MADQSLPSFSLALPGGKKPPAKQQIQISDRADEKKREIIAGIGSGGIESLEQTVEAGPRVIPKQQNTFVVGHGKTNVPFVPPDSSTLPKGADRFEKADEEKKGPTTYGLHVQQRPPTEGEAGPSDRPQGEGRRPGAASSNLQTLMERESHQFRTDLDILPDVPEVEAYETMPIEDFGAAMLRGMGWKEGQGVGKNPEKTVQAIEYVKRPQRLGLGAQPAAPQVKEKKYIKPGETREAPKDMVYVDNEGKQRHIKPVNEKLVERPKAGVHPGKVMRIVGGRHEGLLCDIVRLEPQEEGRSSRASVRLRPSGETVSVRCSELDERDAPAPRGGREGEGGRAGGDRDGGRRESDRDRDRDRDRDSDRSGSGRQASGSRDGDDRGRDAGREGDRGAAGVSRFGQEDRSKKRPREEEEEEEDRRKPEEAPWVFEHIRVRIVDKRVAGGALYLKKATVIDVPIPAVADVRLDDTGRVVQGLRQEQLETVVPKSEGAAVVVLRGPARGQIASLLQKNSKTGLAAVRVTGGAMDDEILKVSLDDIAEHVAV